MIIDLQGFIETESPFWRELEGVLETLERDPLRRLSLAELRRFHYLYDRVSSDLGQVATFASQPETRRYLERLVARAYGEIHETRAVPHRLRPWFWFTQVFPVTFRRHGRAFALALGLTVGGSLFGGIVVAIDPAAREVIMPFEQLLQPPSQRVAREERTVADRLHGAKAQGAAWYIRNNTQVAVTTMALGITWGLGTVLILLTNGVMLGAVCADYLMAGEGRFLLGWLLPHGSVELPAIVLAGQAGFVLAGALIGWGRRMSLRARLRAVTPDLVTLVAGVALMLVWAGIVESFLSQYHQPVLPYGLKIAFGLIELGALSVFLAVSGRARARAGRATKGDA
jgi:uncharacterized membrane protein SpoIIM required for sporulation